MPIRYRKYTLIEHINSFTFGWLAKFQDLQITRAETYLLVDPV